MQSLVFSSSRCSVSSSLIVSTFAGEQQSLTDRRGSLLRKVLLTLRLGNQLEWKPTEETHNLVLCFQKLVATVGNKRGL